MNSMNYIGKFISNFRDFYNEINTATLTGAIDVVVVEQADGTFSCSPFHVRFGKLGVLRSREKVVDIEVNGEALDIHMKLGESGEAFFVEEVSLGELGDDEIIPPHLACSPIPSENFHSRYLEQERLRIQDAAAKKRGFNLDNNNIAEKIFDENKPRWPELKEPSLIELASTQEISLLVSNTDARDSDVDERDLKTPKTFRAETMEGKVSEKVRRISIVTGEFRPIVMEKEVEEAAIDVDTDSKPNDEVVSTTTDDSGKAATSSSGKRKRRKKSFMKKKGVGKKSGNVATEPIEIVETSGGDPIKLPATLQAESIDDQSVENIFEIDDIGDDKLDDGNQLACSYSKLSENNLGCELESGKHVSLPPLSISLPPLSSLQAAKSELASLKHANTETNFHFFSDTEVTPGSSPLDSRPHSPIQSDTEVDRQRHSETVSGEFAGGAKDASEVAQSWRWGELPSPPTPRVGTSRQASTTSLVKEKEAADDGDGMAVQIQEAAAAEAVQRSIISDMFSFMKKTKRLRHNPEGEGIYLADINADELDPDVAALYFPASYRQSIGAQHQASGCRDDDAESGNGTSLPQSPHSVEGAIGGPKSSDSDFEEPKHSMFPENNIAMSLCGGLNEGGPTEDSFLRQLVTYDDLVTNPKLIENPDLVVSLNGSYYNWKTACPMVMSVVLYQRSLPQHLVQMMSAEYMPLSSPKDPLPRDVKLPVPEPGRGYSSWFSWRKSTEPKKSAIGSEVEADPITTTESFEDEADAEKRDEEVEQITAGSMNQSATDIGGVPIPSQTVRPLDEDENAPVPSSFHSTPKASVAIPVPKDVKEEGYNGSNSSEDSDSGPSHGAKLSRDKRVYYEHTDKFRKTLRLSSEQIAGLNLIDGTNEVVFSVTTAYQGTTRCKCHIYKWRHDDRVVISDIDGTITKSDVLGHILPIVGKDWAQSGVAQLFTKIKNNGYKLLYLSARAIGQARVTREYLRSIKQGDLSLPDGPLLLNPTSLISAFHREVIEKKPEEFKISCLRDILALFPADSKPFYAGYGNKVNDVWAYRAVGIPIFRIFTINHRGELKHELTQTFQSSYSNMSFIVDQMFPPPPEVDASEDYSSFVYWREPIADISVDPDIEAIAMKAASKVPNNAKKSPKKTA